MPTSRVVERARSCSRCFGCASGGDPVAVLDQLAKPELTPVRVVPLEQINDRCAVRTSWRLVSFAPLRDSNPFGVGVEQLSERRNVARVQRRERLQYQLFPVCHFD